MGWLARSRADRYSPAYPLIAGAPGARTIFNLVFFVVFTSVLLQATTISLVAKWLNVEAPLVSDVRFPIQHNPTRSLGEELIEIPVPAGSAAAGRTLADLALPTGAVIVLIRRGDEVFTHGTSRIEASDTLLVLAEHEALARVHARVSRT